MIFMVDYIKQLEEEQSKKENSEFAPGDTVEVHQKNYRRHQRTSTGF